MRGLIEIRRIDKRLSLHIRSNYCTSYDVWIEGRVDNHYPAYAMREGFSEKSFLIAIGHSPDEIVQKTLKHVFQYVEKEVHDKDLRFEDPRKNKDEMKKLEDFLSSQTEK